MREHIIGADGLLTHNRRGVELCRKFQEGQCGQAVNGYCPANHNFRHQCAKCLSPDHGAAACTQPVRAQPRDNVGGATYRSKGKGKKGRGRGRP